MIVCNTANSNYTEDSYIQFQDVLCFSIIRATSAEKLRIFVWLRQCLPGRGLRVNKDA